MNTASMKNEMLRPMFSMIVSRMGEPMAMDNPEPEEQMDRANARFVVNHLLMRRDAGSMNPNPYVTPPNIEPM